ncbi:MAG: glycoside hydrolase N-terminal domain-containing protein, partial [Acidobacteria bacterium]|nr:glycoside hydrolase N-terminal domain-containing protein [Acidobacteriota bacterium]
HEPAPAEAGVVLDLHAGDAPAVRCGLAGPERSRWQQLAQRLGRMVQPVDTGRACELALFGPQGVLLDTAPIPSGKARPWAHGCWAPLAAATGTEFVLRSMAGGRTLAERRVTVSNAGLRPVELPLRLDRLNRGLLARLVEREARSVPADQADVPAYLKQHELVYNSPAPSWVEGLPIGNGDVGALVSGVRGKEQTVHLDKTDIWYQAPDGTGLGRSHAGTLRLQYAGGPAAAPFRQRLSLANAEVTTLDGNYRSTIRSHALHNRVEAEVEAGELTVRLERSPVTLWVNRRDGYQNASQLFGSFRSGVSAAKLAGWKREADLAPTTEVRWGHDRNSCWAVNSAPNMRYAMVLRVVAGKVEWRVGVDGCEGHVRRQGGEAIRIQTAIATSRESADPLALARSVTGAADRAAHLGWWHRFWGRSWIELPDKLEENLWYLGLYQQAACSRSDQAVSFFGLWHPLDHRTWYDCYVTDAQVEMMWWLCFPTNHLELLYPSHRTFARLAPEFVRHTERGGMIVPHMVHPEWAGGLPFFNGSNPHKGATSWFVMNFWHDYLYSGDRTFLREVTYPLMRMAADFYVDYLEKGADGKYHIRESTSPEQDGTTRDNTFDWGLLRFLFRAVAQASETLQVDAALRPLWRDRFDHLYAMAGTDTLWESADKAHPYRCLPGVLFPLHPTNAIEYGSPEFARSRRTLEAVTRLVGFRYEDRHAAIPDFEGGVEPNAFSSGILATSAARLGDAALYRRLLYGLVVRYHMKQNGLRALIDTRQSDDISHASLVEAANAQSAAITETLVQSWSDRVRVFPAIAPTGRYRFSGLRTEGGHIISAEAVDGRFRWVRVRFLRGGELKLVVPGARGPEERRLRCPAGETCEIRADSQVRIDTALGAGTARDEPRRVAIASTTEEQNALTEYPENLPFGQTVEDEFLYLGRPAQFGPARKAPAFAALAQAAAGRNWQERQRAARLLALVPPDREALALLDRLCADAMNVVAHTAAVALVHLGTPEALAIADAHARKDAVSGLRREVEKARRRVPAARAVID